MSVAMRAKLKITQVQKHENSANETLHFSAVSRSDKYPEDGSDENNTFAKFSPSASLTLQIANPNLIGKFAAGEEYYLDFTKVEPKATA